MQVYIASETGYIIVKNVEEMKCRYKGNTIIIPTEPYKNPTNFCSRMIIRAHKYHFIRKPCALYRFVSLDRRIVYDDNSLINAIASDNVIRLVRY